MSKGVLAADMCTSELTRLSSFARFRFVPAYFTMEFSDGRPKLTEAGKKALEDEANLVGYSKA